ncbi:hypothetical protein BDW59DRAFT_156264 [Aspergillus cavernicola]|uniref:Rhodopsin domain-containing protein n=1 Tax=Aspergillus cavernicola TaxID=176166 RepID=A0ABR4J2R1_9EURO
MSEEPIIPPPLGVVSNLENPQDVLHTVNLATQVVCIIVVTIIVALRVIIKVHLRKELELEDCEYNYYRMGITLSILTLNLTLLNRSMLRQVLFIGFCANMLVLNNYGGGYHAWDASYAATLLYVPMVFVIKLALLTVMLRIFAPDRHKVIIIYISITVLLLYYIPALFIKIFFCKPISAYWNIGSGTCIDQRNVIIADSAISIASDLWILILPVPMLWSLQMSRTKKLRVVGILGAGGLATGFSIWRLVMMIEEARTADTTWFWIHCVLTANAEAGIGLICACLPTLSSYLVTVNPKSSRSGTTGTGGGGSSYARSHELNSWNKLSGSKSRDRDRDLNGSSMVFPLGHGADQACLISTVDVNVDGDGEGDGEGEGGNMGGRLGRGRARGRGVIHKDVVVEQSFEYVK